MKYFVIIGLGNYSFYLISELKKREKCKICAIDKDEKKLDEIKKIVDEAIVADVKTGEFQEIVDEIDIKSADYVIVNLGEEGVYETISLCMLLQEKGVKNIYVKVISEDQEKALKKIGVTNIKFPERDEAKKLAMQLMFKIEDLLNVDRDISVAKIEAPHKLVGKTLGGENIRKKFNVSVVAIEQKNAGEAKYLLNPGADYMVRREDILIVFGSENDIENFVESYS